MLKPSAMVLTTATIVAGSLCGQTPFQQTQTDDYTRYELLDPTTQSFRIIYDVSATTAGATAYYNTIRRGSEPTVHAVTDLMTGLPLVWALVDGATARAAGHMVARDDTKYIQVQLARPVPIGGQARIRIDKTYRDPDTYSGDDQEIRFVRTLGIPRNAVVLPAGYELTGVNYPSQVAVEADGRVKVSFMNPGPDGVGYTVTGRRLPRPEPTPAVVLPPRPGTAPMGAPGPDRSRARVNYVVEERAFQDRDIVYFLNQPETHSFDLYHDYTEARPGVDRYVNVVRPGSRVSNPRARILDTGQVLDVVTLRGNAIRERGVDIGETITAETEVVLIAFPAVTPGASVRLRIEETYTDSSRYLLHNGELIWDRSFGRPRNTVTLPVGWYLTASAIPGVVDRMEDGRVRIRYTNAGPDNIDVFIKAKRR